MPVLSLYAHLAWFYEQEAIRLKPSFADAFMNQGNVLKVSYFQIIAKHMKWFFKHGPSWCAGHWKA